jgi:16S rRNA (cytosine1402-N4)-methyltransferase
MQSIHEPVLLHEVVEHLVIGSWLFKNKIINNQKPITAWYLDGTLGGAGHAKAVAEAFKKSEKLGGAKLAGIIGLDRDEQALERAKATLKGKADKIILECENFRNLDKVIEKNGVAKIDLILLDLGISSDELDNSGRGFTFQKDEPLLMTMGDPAKYPFTARDIVNKWDEEVIANIIFGYAEERFARRIARAIVNYRQKKAIETSGEFAEIIKSSVPGFYRRGKIHPATKTFQALRIAVNDELGALREGLKKGYEYLSNGGRMAVISFHSLEDRIVKDFYKEKAGGGAKGGIGGEAGGGAKVGDDRDGSGGAIIITKKPIVASPQEIAENPRSRSAKLRVIEKGWD